MADNKQEVVEPIDILQVEKAARVFVKTHQEKTHLKELLQLIHVGGLDVTMNPSQQTSIENMAKRYDEVMTLNVKSKLLKVVP